MAAFFVSCTPFTTLPSWLGTHTRFLIVILYDMSTCYEGWADLVAG
jgi:hypothetical protein